MGGAGAVQVYHTRDDLAKASVEALLEGATCRPFCFCVLVPGSQPVIFAAASPAFRELRMQEFARVAQAPAAEVLYSNNSGTVVTLQSSDPSDAGCCCCTYCRVRHPPQVLDRPHFGRSSASQESYRGQRLHS